MELRRSVLLELLDIISGIKIAISGSIYKISEFVVEEDRSSFDIVRSRLRRMLASVYIAPPEFVYPERASEVLVTAACIEA
jgi:hypothetical protein